MSASKLSLSAAPISDLSPSELARRMAERLGGVARHHERTLHRARARGQLSARTADRVAISLGTHPALLWGEAWERP
jgi:hypothetical protein